jgi:hypothetical protein
MGSNPDTTRKPHPDGSLYRISPAACSRIDGGHWWAEEVIALSGGGTERTCRDCGYVDTWRGLQPPPP